MEWETRENMLLPAQEVMVLNEEEQTVAIRYIYTLKRHGKKIEQLNVLVPQ